MLQYRMCLLQLCTEVYHPPYLHLTPPLTFFQHTVSHLEIMIQSSGHMPCLGRVTLPQQWIVCLLFRPLSVSIISHNSAFDKD